MKNKKVLRDRGGTNELCFGCKLAVGLCPWSDRNLETGEIKYEPIEGWVAEEVAWQNASGEWETTYYIKSCPMFVPDPPRKKDDDSFSVCPLCRGRFIKPSVGRRRYCYSCVPRGYTYDKGRKRLVRYKGTQKL